MRWLAAGKSTWEIARILRISDSTVNYHIGNIKDKLGAANRPQAVAAAIEQEIIGSE